MSSDHIAVRGIRIRPASSFDVAAFHSDNAPITIDSRVNQRYDVLPSQIRYAKSIGAGQKNDASRTGAQCATVRH